MIRLSVWITNYNSHIRIIKRVECGITACESSCSKVHIIFLLSLIFFILVLVPPAERSCFKKWSCCERSCCKHSFFSFRFCCVFVFVLSLYSVYHIDYNRSTTDFFIFLILCFSFCFSCLFLFFDYSIAHTLQQKYNTEQLFQYNRKNAVLG